MTDGTWRTDAAIASGWRGRGGSVIKSATAAQVDDMEAEGQ
jgi:hypothetical protein